MMAAYAARFFLFFFRDPNRIPPTDADAVLSPADGRVLVAGRAIAEILIASPEFERRVAAGAPPESIAEAARANGCIPLWESGLALVRRGETSDLLSRDTAGEMKRRGPKARVVEIRGVGHAPTLLHADQIGVVRDFLLQAE